MYTQSPEKVHISPWFVIVFAHKCENFLATGLYAMTSFYFSIQNLCDLSGDNWKSLLKGFVDLVSFWGVLRAILGRFLRYLGQYLRQYLGQYLVNIFDIISDNMWDNIWNNNKLDAREYVGQYLAQSSGQSGRQFMRWFFWMLGSSTKRVLLHSF